jgi:hypothetical protein
VKTDLKFKPHQAIVTTNRRLTKVNDVATQKSSWKPEGLWYGCGSAWIDWCKAENFDGIGKNFYELVLDRSKILVIENLREFDEFEKRFVVDPPYMDAFKSMGADPDRVFRHAHIDWNSVSCDYAGIEINPYQWERRLNRLWYYGWDCASGCIWNKRAVLKVVSLNINYSSSLQPGRPRLRT